MIYSLLRWNKFKQKFISNSLNRRIILVFPIDLFNGYRDSYYKTFMVKRFVYIIGTALSCSIPNWSECKDVFHFQIRCTLINCFDYHSTNEDIWINWIEIGYLILYKKCGTKVNVKELKFTATMSSMITIKSYNRIITK